MTKTIDMTDPKTRKLFDVLGYINNSIPAGIDLRQWLTYYDTDLHTRRDITVTLAQLIELCRHLKALGVLE